MIARPSLHAAIEASLSRAPVAVLTGPRQSGKTTLARQFVDPSSANYFDLEDPVSLARLDEPMTALQPLRGLVVIDEVQRRPELFPVLRVLVDRPDLPARFLILGSASGKLLRQSSESLAGRVERLEISGFTLAEVGPTALQQLWSRGSFPRSFLASEDAASSIWRKEFIQTLLERDLPQWGVRAPASTLRRFWSILANYHGQTWNAREPARALDVSEQSTRRYLDILTDALMVRQLQPWFANITKRQVKSPKIYIRDSGLLHQLLGLPDLDGLLTHPKIGASWEGFALEQVLRTEPHDEAYFWATHQGAEMDLVLHSGTATNGVEFKRADAPRITKSIRIASEDLGLERVAILYPGPKRYSLADNIEVVPLESLSTGEPLFPRPGSSRER